MCARMILMFSQSSGTYNIARGSVAVDQAHLSRSLTFAVNIEKSICIGKLRISKGLRCSANQHEQAENHNRYKLNSLHGV